MPLVMTLEGSNEVIEQSIDAFSRQNGWTPESEKTQLQFSRDVLAAYLRENIVAYNAIKAAEKIQKWAENNKELIQVKAREYFEGLVKVLNYLIGRLS
jgi:hypothetical protein